MHAPANHRRVTLLTDFRTADGYVAAMKGVIAAIVPSAIIDDVSHDIPPGDVRAAAWALGAYWRLYPPGTVHVAVVDPGVGSARRPIAIEIDGRFIIAPDNGIVTPAVAASATTHAVVIRSAAIVRHPSSATFHGRDIFAPAAGHILAGMRLDELGPAAGDLVLLPHAAPVRDGDSMTGSVVHIDRFGNLITDIPGDAVNAGRLEAVNDGDVEARGMRIPVRRTYSDVKSGEFVALIGSRGVLELSVRDGSAAEVLGMSIGDAVVWRGRGEAGGRPV